MISTGIIRSIDSLGRVVLPKELRRTFEITTDTPLEIMTEGDACVLCGQVSPGSVQLYGKTVCPACQRALAEKEQG